MSVPMPERQFGIDLAQSVAQSYATQNMVSQVLIERMTQTPVNEVDKSQAVVATATIYEGPCRISGISGPDTIMLGGGPQVFSAGYISIPLNDCGVQVGDVVQVTAHKDPMLVGRNFRVTDVQTGDWLPTVRRLQVLGIDRSDWTVSVPDPQASLPDIPVSWTDL